MPGQRWTTGLLAESNLFTVSSVILSLSHSLNLSIMGVNYHGKDQHQRHIVVVDFEKVAADFKEN